MPEERENIMYAIALQVEAHLPPLDVIKILLTRRTQPWSIIKESCATWSTATSPMLGTTIPFLLHCRQIHQCPKIVDGGGGQSNFGNATIFWKPSLRHLQMYLASKKGSRKTCQLPVGSELSSHHKVKIIALRIHPLPSFSVNLRGPNLHTNHKHRLKQFDLELDVIDMPGALVECQRQEARTQNKSWDTEDTLNFWSNMLSSSPPQHRHYDKYKSTVHL